MLLHPGGLVFLYLGDLVVHIRVNYGLIDNGAFQNEGKINIQNCLY